MLGPAIQGGIVLALGAALFGWLRLRRARPPRVLHSVEAVPEAALVEPELVSDPAWSAPLVAHTEQLLPTLAAAAPPPIAAEPVGEPAAAPEPEPEPAPVVVASFPLTVFAPPPEEPAVELEEELVVDAADPFASFWLDASAPMPAGLTAGYLPPLTGMWSTPAGETL
jgi:hypothetical protein